MRSIYIAARAPTDGDFGVSRRIRELFSCGVTLQIVQIAVRPPRVQNAQLFPGGCGHFEIIRDFRWYGGCIKAYPDALAQP